MVFSRTSPTVQIQRSVRGLLCRARRRSQRKKDIRAAVRLQGVCRGWIMRYRTLYPSTRKH